jgi:zinc transport system substrate-binding protein
MPRRCQLVPRALLGLIAALAGACGRPRPDAGGPLRVVVSIAPLTGLAAELAPPGAAVTTLVPPGRSLHSYEVTPSDVSGLGRADVVVHIGLGLDSAVGGFLAKHPSAERRDVCFADAVGLKLPDGSAPHDHDHVEDHDHADEGHGNEDHDEPSIDQHLWLDPALVARLVPELRRAIEDAQSARGLLTDAERTRLDAAEADLLARIAAVDREYAERLRPLAGRAIVTHHDAFRRIAERYGLEIAAVIRPIESTEPTPGAIARAAEAVRARGARAVFFEPQFDAASARRIAEAAGARLGRLDPEGDTDWFRLMRTNLDSLVTNLSD